MRPLSAAALAAFFLTSPARADDRSLEQQLASVVRPFLQANCVPCHGPDRPKGQLDLSAVRDLRAAIHELAHLETAAEMIASGEMPPAKAKTHPSSDQRAPVLAWIRAVRQQEARRNAGDPGPVLARRLSNAEYDYTVRDLTGVDIRPTREFPVDPANEAGFDNSGESLVMSPALLKKYLDAARAVSEHVVLGPTGLAFAPRPVVSDTDRDAYAVERIVRFYQRQPTDLARYFLAAWRFRHRAALGHPRTSLDAIAAQEHVAPGYLRTVRAALDHREEVGPLATLQHLFDALPPREAEARAGCERMRDLVQTVRTEVAPVFPNLQMKGVSSGSQPFVLWKDIQRATHRTSCDDPPLYVAGAPPHDAAATVRAEAGLAMALTHFTFRNIVHDSALPVPFGVHELASTFAPPDPALAIPDEAARPRTAAAFRRFCHVFPDAFYVAERARTQLDQGKDRRAREEKGRWLSAGFANMFGFFRDDAPLYQQILDGRQRRELDELWRALDFITLAPMRQHADFLFYERGESRTMRGPAFDFVRAADKDATSPALLRRLATTYLAQARENLRTGGGDPRGIPALETFFTNVMASIGRVQRDRVAAEPAHLQALLTFAARAYRRPLTSQEKGGLLGFYRSLRADGVDHESAVRDAVARVLMSPHFLYRLDLVAGGGVRPLGDQALASRLSYFLWSSLPDRELLAHAAAGDLHRPDILAAQARRMLQDPRARALAVEFGGNWLDFRRFEEWSSVDRQRFPTFDNDLRQAMFEEPVRFFVDVIQQDRSVLDFLYADHTFVNAPLARHYGMPAPATGDWVRFDGAGRYHRGGILPMAVFLTKNAPGLRTSPVKRGYWVVRRALGERIPPPPAQVPELPADERNLGALTLREVLARHRQNPACASCHARFDSFGLAFEGYGPIGELRTRDLGGHPVEDRATFPGGEEGAGLDGVRQYVRAHRQGQFVDTLCRKLLSFALGRTLIPSDDVILERMLARLAADGNRFGSLIRTIVTSPQFLNRRGGDELARM
jgi:mono/diheme cytochrome c family protein